MGPKIFDSKRLRGEKKQQKVLFWKCFFLTVKVMILISSLKSSWVFDYELSKVCIMKFCTVIDFSKALPAKFKKNNKLPFCELTSYPVPQIILAKWGFLSHFLWYGGQTLPHPKVFHPQKLGVFNLPFWQPPQEVIPVFPRPTSRACDSSTCRMAAVRDSCSAWLDTGGNVGMKTTPVFCGLGIN